MEVVETTPEVKCTEVFAVKYFDRAEDDSHRILLQYFDRSKAESLCKIMSEANNTCFYYVSKESVFH